MYLTGVVWAVQVLLLFWLCHPAIGQDKAGHERMHSMNVECGILMDMLRCDGEKGMANLKNMRGAVVPLHAYMYLALCLTSFLSCRRTCKAFL